MNMQPTEKPVPRSDAGYEIDVVDVWDTIQGEGPFAGTPAAFVRLAGCNLQCPLCDTDYTSTRRKYPPGKVAELVAGFGRRLVVLTGGEPFRQNLSLLLELLLRDGRRVQIETNGSLWPHDVPKSVVLVCSPKTPSVHKDAQRRANYWKYILQEGKVDPSDGLPTSSLGMSRPPARPFTLNRNRENVFVQPLDEDDPARNKLNLEAAVESCKRFGYRLTVQIHKQAGLP